VGRRSSSFSLRNVGLSGFSGRLVLMPSPTGFAAGSCAASKAAFCGPAMRSHSEPGSLPTLTRRHTSQKESGSLNRSSVGERSPSLPLGAVWAARFERNLLVSHRDLLRRLGPAPSPYVGTSSPSTGTHPGCEPGSQPRRPHQARSLPRALASFLPPVAPGHRMHARSLGTAFRGGERLSPARPRDASRGS
jgi:hypothetical protein